MEYQTINHIDPSKFNLINTFDSFVIVNNACFDTMKIQIYHNLQLVLADKVRDLMS